MQLMCDQLIDPLSNFGWNTLHDKYKKKCRGFKSTSRWLGGLNPRPASDLELYYQLAERFAAERVTPNGISLPSYVAMLYWKFYSLGRGIADRRCDKASKEQRAVDMLKQLSICLPSSLNRDRAGVVEMIKNIDLPGIEGSCTFPVRTTFLHFVHPETVPVFDKMVLQAIGYSKKDAEKGISEAGALSNYLEHIWALEKRYLNVLPTGARETPLRLIEMALWVNRGEQQWKGDCSCPNS